MQTYIKPQVRFVTDVTIVLECLYEVYRQEGKQLSEGKDIRKTMLFPFFKMLERDPDYGKKVDINKAHENMWNIFQGISSQSDFTQQALDYLRTL